MDAAIAWLCSNGVLMAANSTTADMVHAPFALRPTKVCIPYSSARAFLTHCPSPASVQFPRRLFAHGLDLAVPYNQLYHAVACKHEWLLATLER